MKEEILSDKPIEVKEGHMYYVGPKGFIWEGVPGDPRPPKKVNFPKIRKVKGFRYYVNFEGFVCKSRLRKTRKTKSKKSKK